MDYDEANAHHNANSGVHGISGSVVGTSDAQNLTSKTLTSPAFAGTASGNLTTTGNVQGAAVTATGNATVGGTLAVNGGNASIPAGDVLSQGLTTQIQSLSNFSLPPNTSELVPFKSTTPDINTLGLTVQGTNNEQVKIAVAGRYEISGQLAAFLTNGVLKAGITKNGTTGTFALVGGHASSPDPSHAAVAVFPVMEVTLAANDYLGIFANADLSGAGSANVSDHTGTAANPISYLRIKRVG